jgi:hypothetical protein
LCRRLEDGSYLSQIFATKDYYQCSDPEHVRVIEYTLDGGSEVYRLITTILGPEQAPARELAVLYHQRWEIESLLDELKVHQGAGSTLRSKSPDGVAQEVHGMLLVHHALRQLAHLAARSRDVDPDRISFTRTLPAARREVPAQAGFSPPDDWPGPLTGRWPRSPAGSCRSVGRVPIPAWSSGRCPTGA